MSTNQKTPAPALAVYEGSDLKRTTATWKVELNCECPHCKEYVDLLTTPDFWDGRDLEIAEHGTKRSKALDVVCPDCGKDFEVECEY